MISGKEIDLAFKTESHVKDAYKKQHSQSVFSTIFGGKKTKVTAVALSEQKLKAKLKQSVLIKGSDTYKITKPVDATIVYSADKKYGVIQKEDEGNYLNRKAFYDAVEKSIESLSNTLNLTDEKKNPDVYKKPGLYHDDEELKQMQTTYNEYLLHFIQWDMGNNVKETLGPDALKDCIKVNTKRHTVKLDQPAVEKWLESFCLKYKTQGIARTFKTHSGKKIKVSGGDYGWRIDYDKVIAQTMKALKKAPEESAIKAYEKDPSKENEQALLTKLKTSLQPPKDIVWIIRTSKMTGIHKTTVKLTCQHRKFSSTRKENLYSAQPVSLEKQHQIVSQEPVFMTSKRRNLQRH